MTTLRCMMSSKSRMVSWVQGCSSTMVRPGSVRHLILDAVRLSGLYRAVKTSGAPACPMGGGGGAMEASQP